MEITILGSGSAIMREKRRSASHLVKTNSGKSLLLDAGSGVPVNILKTGQDVQKLDHILITHAHGDHLGNLIPLMQSMLVDGYDVSGEGWQERRRTKPLYLHGYKGFTDHYEALRKIMFPERAEPYEIKIAEYQDNERTFDDVVIKGTEVTHVPQYWSASAFRVEADGKSIVYTGDCGYDERFVKLARNADVGLFEMSVPVWMYKAGPRPNHLSAFECGLVAAKSGVKKLVLVHMFDNDSEEAITEAVRQNFKGELIISEDLQRIEV
ncbi:MAG: MBL fold metallo-hydrolase [Candidatus Marsarchaeota archaeon]|jgi:ribonuclease BN (tRNA processing enzyme)|nr:MBL fold metallo-hydrolase [Candidatus Marsarchaeota archaeon]MCL5111362.1 MBL fold metallo-hydrolase [Candidatus Marsarchaeota archaeon]